MQDFYLHTTGTGSDGSLTVEGASKAALVLDTEVPAAGPANAEGGASIELENGGRGWIVGATVDIHAGCGYREDDVRLWTWERLEADFIKAPT